METKDKERENNSEERYPAMPEIIPEPTWWPIAAAFGIFFIFLGILTTLIISGIGILLSAIAFSGWIQDWNHEQG